MCMHNEHQNNDAPTLSKGIKKNKISTYKEWQGASCNLGWVLLNRQRDSTASVRRDFLRIHAQAKRLPNLKV